MKTIFISIIVLLAGIAEGGPQKEITYPNKKQYYITLNEKFNVAPKAGWTLYPEKEYALHSGTAVLKGANNAFKLSLQFQKDALDSAKLETAEKMREAFVQQLTAMIEESGGKQTVEETEISEFAPAGYFGFITRVPQTGKNILLDGEDWSYVTLFLFRAGRETVITATLYTNTIEDDVYGELLHYVADFAIPEVGSEKWKVANARDARVLAEAFWKKQNPTSHSERAGFFNIIKLAGGWQVMERGWRDDADRAKLHVRVDGVTGEVIPLVTEH